MSRIKRAKSAAVDAEAIAVLAVMFLREAVARTEELDLLRLGVALALMIAALVFFLTMKRAKKE